MGYIIKNTYGLINTRLTDTGRQLLSQGNFNISYFQIGDSEVCYECAQNVLPASGFVLEPAYNAQNSTGAPQSNKENVKYPFFLDGTSGNTYGIPTMESTEVPLYNFVETLGFFSGNPSQVSVDETICKNPNFEVADTEFTGGTQILLTPTSCNPAASGTPEVMDFLTIVFDGGNCGQLSTNIPVLTYRIQEISGSGVGPYLVTLDRTVPNYVDMGCNLTASAFVYASGMTPFYYTTTPQGYFCNNCSSGSTTPIWNMNIPWSESVAGIFPSVNEDYSYYGSVNYLGTKEYLGYQSKQGQVFENYSGITATTDTFYYNSYDERINVQPEDQKAIAIVHYTNTSVVNYYGEKFADRPYDPAFSGDPGFARNFKIEIPTLMWHKTTGTTMGQTFYIDPPGFDLLEPSYMLSLKNEDMNSPGMRYYHLYDTNPNTNGLPSRVGKVFPDQEIVVFDDDEIVAALSNKSNRNWTLPAPKLSLIAPNVCNNGVDSVGILSADTEAMWVTYRFNSSAFTESLHCNYYSYIQGPSTGCSITSQNVTVRFGEEFPFLAVGGDCSGFSANEMIILAQVTLAGERPDPSSWRMIDVTPELSPTLVSNYIVESGLTNTTFTISLNDYSGASIYDLSTYIDIPMNGETDKLQFGDEYYFYGNLDTDIQGTIYEMKYAINLQEEQFTVSSNPTASGSTQFNITEIGLYNSNKDLMILSKMQYPIVRQGIQQFLIKFDF